MSTKTRLSEMLLEAATRLDPVDLMSPAPMLNLRAACALMTTVWEDSASFIDPRLKKPLRLSILYIRNIIKAEHGILQEEDSRVISGTAATLRRIAPLIAVPRASLRSRDQAEARSPQPAMQRSSRGLRWNSLQELADARPFVVAPSATVFRIAAADEDHDDDVSRLSRHDADQQKLPRAGHVGAKFVLAPPMPLLVYFSGYVNETALNRSGMTWSMIRDQGASRRAGPPGAGAASRPTHAILLEGQKLIGFRESDLKDSGGAIVTQVERLFSHKRGPHVNPLAGHGDPGESSTMLRSPGNPLAWLWLVPEAVVNSRALASIKSVGFPWRSRESNAESHRMIERDRQEALNELRELESQQEILLKQGQMLDRTSLQRISALRDAVYRDSRTNDELDNSPVARQARVRAARLELEERLEREKGTEIVRARELERTLKDYGKPKAGESPAISEGRKEIKQRLAAIQREIEDARQDLARRMRNQPKKQ